MKEPWPRGIDFCMINPWKIILIVIILCDDGFKEIELSLIITAGSTPLNQLFASGRTLSEYKPVRQMPEFPGPWTPCFFISSHSKNEGSLRG